MPEGIQLAEIPTSDSFYELSLVADRFIDKASKAIVFELDKLACDVFREADIPDVAAACARLIKDQYNEILSDECKKTMEWFEAEPAFAMAFKTVGYLKVADDHWEAPILRELERWLPRFQGEKNASASYIALRIARLPSHYINYVSRVAGASYRYVSHVFTGCAAPSACMGC